MTAVAPEPVLADLWLAGADDLRQLAPQLTVLYRRCFDEPPWSASPDRLDEFPAKLAADLEDNPRLRGTVLSDRGDLLLGAAYGWPAPAALPDTTWHRVLAATLDSEQLQHLLSPAMIVAELMVRPSARGRGYGRLLLEALVAHAPSAWLCTHPESTAATLYERWGWQRLAAFTSYRGAPRVVFVWPGGTAR
ncbi:MAG TPA: GNAT family N-acetyltransferase [Cryptosporangiaceae bacterium]|nr:GNAT family N-acetyltransferase [Cryptosporangiaceae bacterium]